MNSRPFKQKLSEPASTQIYNALKPLSVFFRVLNHWKPAVIYTPYSTMPNSAAMMMFLFLAWYIVFALQTPPCRLAFTVVFVASSANTVLNSTGVIYLMFLMTNLFLFSRNLSGFITGCTT